MAAVLASHSCCCHNVELIAQDSLSFSSSISVNKFSKSVRPTCNPPPHAYQFPRFQVEMRQTESPSRLGVNGRAVKMVPASEVVKRKVPATNKVEKVNNLPNKVEKVNGSVVNGASLVKRNPTTPTLVKAPKYRTSNELPPVEELKVLPSDEGFSWANENYNSWQRSIDVWSFVLSLRVRVLFDNAKWAYMGGFTEEKQVRFEAIYVCYHLLIALFSHCSSCPWSSLQSVC